ncbi:hypothetical protein [Phenylobacterium sp.]|uniref:hypothetical protein n=1 Tax=Phenylobacterium sp. TaxID=1871053 RepID=UPI002DE72379|nr:hypothetical protein [Phenylobacterium sp.]
MAAFVLILHVLQALAPAIALALIGAYGAKQKQAGAQLEAAATDAATATTETAIAQAEVAAPATAPAVVDQLNAGEF